MPTSAPDEKRLAVSLLDPKTGVVEIWLTDLVRNRRCVFPPEEHSRSVRYGPRMVRGLYFGAIGMGSLSFSKRAPQAAETTKSGSRQRLLARRAWRQGV